MSDDRTVDRLLDEFAAAMENGQSARYQNLRAAIVAKCAAPHPDALSLRDEVALRFAVACYGTMQSKDTNAPIDEAAVSECAYDMADSFLAARAGGGK